MRQSIVACVALLAACGSESGKPSHSPTGTGGSLSTGSGGVDGSGGSLSTGSGGIDGSGTTGTSAGAAGDSGGAGEGGLAGAGGAPGGGDLPSLLLLSGSASLEVDDPNPGAGGEAGASGLPPIDRVECSFYAEVFDLVANEDGGWSGIAVGEVFRNLYSGDQRFEFSAFVGGPATLTALAGDRVELRAVGDQTGAKAFWRELEVLEGRSTQAYAYEGSWTCASLELNEPGFPDMGPIAEGTWELDAELQ